MVGCRNDRLRCAQADDGRRPLRSVFAVARLRRVMECLERGLWAGLFRTMESPPIHDENGLPRTPFPQ